MSQAASGKGFVLVFGFALKFDTQRQIIFLLLLDVGCDP